MDIARFAEANRPKEPFLSPVPFDAPKKTLVLDLDETLVHSSFSKIKDPDFVIKVEYDGMIITVYVKIRPYVKVFLERMS